MTFIVVGLGFGDEGKGATVDALTARTGARAVVRFNGGQQAAHNVIANLSTDGVTSRVHHTFQSYGSGTLAGAETWISRYCTVEPSAALRERVALRSKKVWPEKIHVDNDCLVTTGFHTLVNRLREEARGEDRHGSTGRGFGETIAYSLQYPDDAPRVRDLADQWHFAELLDLMARRYSEEGFEFSRDDYTAAMVKGFYQCVHATDVFDPFDGPRLAEVMASGDTILEGAQGFWLDENFGFSPHTTWSTTTPANARRLCREAGVEPVTVGVLRTYATRHGQGPFPNEGSLDRPEEPHNSDGAYAGSFRVGRWDETLLKAAVNQTVPDMLALTHLDRFPGIMVSGRIMAAAELGVPVYMTAAGPGREHRAFAPELDSAIPIPAMVG